MKIRIVIATSNGLGFIILTVAMQVEKFCKEIYVRCGYDSYQDYRFTSSIKGRNNLSLRKRRIEKNREEDLEEELEEVMNQKNQTRKEKV